MQKPNFGALAPQGSIFKYKHTKTGNPLVDSVTEHQPANSQAYFQYLSYIVYLAPIGFGMVALR